MFTENQFSKRDSNNYNAASPDLISKKDIKETAQTILNIHAKAFPKNIQVYNLEEMEEMLSNSEVLVSLLKINDSSQENGESIGYILGYPLTSKAVKLLVEGNEEIPDSGDAGLTRAVDMSKNNLYIEAAGIIDNIFYKAQYHKLFSDFLYHAKNQGYDTIVMHARAETLNNVLKNKEIDIESPDKETKEKYGVAIFENWWGLGQRFTRVIIGINDACDLFPSV